MTMRSCVRSLARFLRSEGFDVDRASDGSQGIERALSGSYALVMLDVMMPDLSGFDVLRRIRARSRTPVLMLTARGDTHDRVLGLELGADDYLPKPFDPAELAARIRAILRRSESAGGLPHFGPAGGGRYRIDRINSSRDSRWTACRIDDG